MRTKFIVGAVLFSIIMLFLFVGPFVCEVNPDGIDLYQINPGPSDEHPLGTDNIGRDILARLMSGEKCLSQ